MTEEALFQKKYPIKEGDFARAGEASVKVKNVLKEIGYDDYWVFEVEGMGLAVAEESKKGFDEIMAKYW